MATQLNNWLSIDKTSGTGNAEITLTASSYEELVDRTTSLKIQGISANAILNVRQNAFVPQVTITPSVLNIDSIGGSETITITSNVRLELVSDVDWITISDKYPTDGTTNITITVNANGGDIRLGIIRVLTFVGNNEIAQITITQKAFNGNDYVSLIYETTEENEILRLTRCNYNINGTYRQSLTDYIDVIIIDGVMQTVKNDRFTIPQAGEHQVYLSFIDKTFNWLSTYPTFYKNTKLKRVTIPSNYVLKSGHYPYGLFMGCTKLEYADLNGVMIDYNGQHFSPFAECSNLKYVRNYRLYNDDEITNNICSDSPKLEEFTIYNNTVPRIIGSDAFNGCKLLPNDFVLRYIHKKGVGYNSIIKTRAFMGCSLLNGENGTIDFSNWESIGGGAFEGCSLIKEVYVNANGVYGTPAFGVSGGFNNAFYQIGDILHIMDNGTFNLTNTTFKKVICHKLLNNFTADWFGNKKRYDSDIYPLVEEIEFLSEEQQDMRYESQSGVDWSFGKFAYLPNLKKLIFHSTLPPIVNYNTLENTVYNGTLVYPEGADYSQLLSTDEYYLGYYGWNNTIVPNPWFNISQNSAAIGKNSTNITITLETNARWHIETDASWLSVSQNNGLQGTTNFDIVVSENNTSNTRIGSITIYSETDVEGGKITITQYNEYGDRILYTSTTKGVVNLTNDSTVKATDGSVLSIISNTYDVENDVCTIVFSKDINFINANFENESVITHITLPAFIKRIGGFTNISVEELRLPLLLESMEKLAFRYSNIRKIYFGENFSKMESDCFYYAPREMYFTTLTPPSCDSSIGYKGYVDNVDKLTTVYVPTEALDAYKNFRNHFFGQVIITSMTS